MRVLKPEFDEKLRKLKVKRKFMANLKIYRNSLDAAIVCLNDYED